MKKFIFIVFLALTLCACAKQKLSFEQEQLRQASQQCQQEATDMNPENPTSMNPVWNSYYTMCMNRFGYTDKEINSIWY
ncbi:MAG: hypothetical protein HDQ93_00170 [Desulfovibrio sp.]|nr:hypothetical protein [Desulfovibrio sp.]